MCGLISVEAPRKYCSKKCILEVRARDNRKKKQKELAGKYPNNFCRWCGAHYKPNGKEFCKPACGQAFAQQKTATGNLSEISERSAGVRHKFGNKLINTWLTGGFNQGIKNAILERDSYCCFICGKTTRLHVHHIIPRIEGGANAPENLVTLCAGCHRSVESGRPELAIKSCVRRALQG